MEDLSRKPRFKVGDRVDPASGYKFFPPFSLVDTVEYREGNFLYTVSSDQVCTYYEHQLSPARGYKADSGKPPLSLISRIAQEEEAKVLDFGRKKYDAWNWARGMKWSRPLDAAMRHLTAFADGEDNDPETGLSHLAHARCCLGFLLDYQQSFPELDDRRPRDGVFGVRAPDGKPQMQVEVQSMQLFPEL